MLIQEDLSTQQKLEILSDAAKCDVSCTSSGVNREGTPGALGSAVEAGLCHNFSADGRCVSLLKTPFTNQCIYDCKYYINRVSSDVMRTFLTPEEACTLTMEFYRRNYIEGLFLSSRTLYDANYTMELIYQTLKLLRQVHHFCGYIHVKAIPEMNAVLVEKVGPLADRMSVDLEPPTVEGLKRLASGKSRSKVLTPMRQIQTRIAASRNELTPYQRRNRSVPAGQSTQMIVGAMPENDSQMTHMAEALYKNYDLKCAFYSASIRVNNDSSLPALLGGSPLLREYRLYQADWFMRFYGFQAGEPLSEEKPNFNVLLDPKCDWVLRHLEQFSVEMNRADYYTLLRVPGMGAKSTKRTVAARKSTVLDFPDSERIGVVLKRVMYLITCNDRMMQPVKIDRDYIAGHLVREEKRHVRDIENRDSYQQLSLFDDVKPTMAPTAQGVRAATIGDL